MMKQISLTLPESVVEASREVYEMQGFRNLQEFILQLLREKVGIESIARWKAIEERMKQGKGVTRLSQKKAIAYLKNL
ncbi:MAG TPA: hypothetical protein VJH88_01355 [Candidatus Nanoarchaeia archaeon]|nr:hypothetical protein [Candidatus Nanoarchaeia archaeon]